MDMVTDRPTIALSVLAGRAGGLVGRSEWLTIDQAQIDAFAAVTHDHQYIHVDPVAAKSVFGGTIAHGFLTLSMISLMAVQALPAIAGGVMEVNYGFNRIRFLTPVRSGSRVRGSFVLMGLEERNPGEWLARYDVTIEIGGEPKPALVAEWMMLTVLGTQGEGQ
jgi:acyl dehydratase